MPRFVYQNRKLSDFLSQNLNLSLHSKAEYGYTSDKNLKKIRCAAKKWLQFQSLEIMKQSNIAIKFQLLNIPAASTAISVEKGFKISISEKILINFKNDRLKTQFFRNDFRISSISTFILRPTLKISVCKYTKIFAARLKMGV